MELILLTAEQAAHVRTLGDPNHAKVDPREITLGDLVGTFIVPARVLTDETYQTYSHDVIDYLSTLPTRELEPREIFVQEVEPT